MFLCVCISGWKLEGEEILERNCTVIVYVHLRVYATLSINQSRKLKSRYGARNRFQEPSLELSSQAT
jgi:hypothetical protein